MPKSKIPASGNMEFYNKSFIYSLIINLILFFLLLGVFEVSVRLFLRKEGKLAQILNILEQDPILIWRQRANIKMIFQDQEVRTNFIGLRDDIDSCSKKHNCCRIVCLGASPTFGWAVRQEETYPYKLENILKTNKTSAEKYEVVNAGVIGYSSWQGALFLKKEILKFNPDIVTVSYSVNDVDRYRFYRSNGKSDKELGQGNFMFIALENFLNKSKFIRWLKITLNNIKNKNMLFSIKNREMIYPQRRVSEMEYRENLDLICNILREKGIKVVFINIPVNDNPPKLITKEEDLSGRNCISLGLSYLKAKDYDLAVGEFKKAIEYNPYASSAFFYLWSCYKGKKEFAIAEEYFRRWKEMQAVECEKDINIYNGIMKEVSESRGLPLVDIVSAFAGEEDLFVTPIHPNNKGHNIIAEKVYQTLIDERLIDF